MAGAAAKIFADLYQVPVDHPDYEADTPAGAALRADIGGPAPRRADGGHDPAARRSRRS